MTTIFQILANAVPPAAGTEASGNLAAEIATKFGIEPGPLLVQVCSFAVLALVVWYFGFRPLMATVAERQKKIEDGLKFHDDMKAKLAQSEADYKAKMAQAAQDASAVLDAARKSAKETVEKAAQDAIARAEETERRAAENIAREREKMLAELKGEVAALVVETTAKLLARDLPAAEKTRLAPPPRRKSKPERSPTPENRRSAKPTKKKTKTRTDTRISDG